MLAKQKHEQLSNLADRKSVERPEFAGQHALYYLTFTTNERNGDGFVVLVD